MSNRARQSHNKSRGGCNQCKIRRIKCDEGGPPCISCVARKSACEYSHRARLAQRQHSSGTRSASSSQLVEGNNAPSATRQLVFKHSDTHLLELELMNYWTARTYLTMCHQAGQAVEKDEQILWQELMPREALSHEYLLRSLLAIAGLHLATQSEIRSRQRYLEAAIASHTHSIELFSNALSSATHENAQALVACSLSNFVYGIALAEILPDRDDQSSIVDHILSMLALIDGAKKIMHMFSERLKNSPINIVLSPKSMDVYTGDDMEFANAVARLRQLNDLRLLPSDVEQHRVVALAIQELDESAKRLASNIGAATIGWLLSLDGAFIQHVRERDVMATLTLMHWAVLLERPNDLWWSFKSGKSLLEELSKTLPPLDSGEHLAYQWCRTQIFRT